MKIINTKNTDYLEKIYKPLGKENSKGESVNRFCDSSIRVYEIFENARQMVNALNTIDKEDEYVINFIAHQSIELCKKTLILWADDKEFLKKCEKKEEKKHGISTHVFEDIKLPNLELSKVLKVIENKLDGLSNVYFDYRFGNSKTINSLGFESKSDSVILFKGDNIIKLVNLYYLISLIIMKEYFICLRSSYNGLKNKFVEINIENVEINVKIGLLKLSDNDFIDLKKLKDLIEKHIEENSIIKCKDTISINKEKDTHIRMLLLLNKLIDEGLNIETLENIIDVNKDELIRKCWILYGLRMEIDILLEEYDEISFYYENSYEEHESYIVNIKNSYEDKKEEILKSFYRIMNSYEDELFRFNDRKEDDKEYNIDIEYLEYIYLTFRKIYVKISEIFNSSQLEKVFNGFKYKEYIRKEDKLNKNIEYILNLLQ